MKTTVRFENAVKKLYIAFHNNALHPECCKQCAVGNILDQTDNWKYLSDFHGSLKLNYIGLVHQNLGRKFNGYSPFEILQIEAVFLKACGYTIPLHYKNEKPKQPDETANLFNGLCKVIELLCALDGIQNVLDYSKLFEIENNKPKYLLVNH
jgi:hypothetical protein